MPVMVSGDELKVQGGVSATPPFEQCQAIRLTGRLSVKKIAQNEKFRATRLFNQTRQPIQ
jgi:hypothetical protein